MKKENIRHELRVIRSLVRGKMLLIIAATLSRCTPAPAGLVADTMFNECRGEIKSGQMAVASVIWNRAGGDPSKLKAVCLKPKQFSCWNKGYVKTTPRNKREAAIMVEFESIEKQMVDGAFKPSGNWTHYCRTDCFPVWRIGMNSKTAIGSHIFGKCK